MMDTGVARTILVVEDSADWHRIYRRSFGNLGTVVIATTREEAERLFTEHRDSLALVIMDACLTEDGGPDTMLIVRKMRESGYTGIIIGASSIDEYNKLLMEAGCDVSEKKSFELVQLACSKLT